MFNFLKRSLARKRARRITNEYSYNIETFHLQDEGAIQFANWLNPLVKNKIITQSEINFYKRFIKPGDMAIDIGTNIGDTTIPMALAAGKSGLALGFDPNPFVYKILEVNAKLNPDKVNIQTFPYAVTDKEMEFIYSSSEASFANGGIQEVNQGIHGKYSLPDKIKGIRLTDFLLKNYADRLDRLAYIKVDAEGLDSMILKSIKDIIEKYSPVVVAECFTDSSPGERYDLFNTVSLPGYKLYKFDDFLDNTVITPLLHKEDMTKWKTFNLYGIRS